MDLSKYRCLATKDSYRKCLASQMNCTDHINIFIPVEDKFDFDISMYKGPLPVAIISKDKRYVYGYTKNTQVNSIYSLEPHASKPPPQYLWSLVKPQRTFKYGQVMHLLNHRCVQLASPPPELNTTVQLFEDSRYIVWLCVTETKCIPLERLIELEINYMIAITKENRGILETCKRMYKLENATQDDLIQWIKNLYNKSKIQGNTNGLFSNVGKQVGQMLS